jgi:hypothetical protein
MWVWRYRYGRRQDRLSETLFKLEQQSQDADWEKLDPERAMANAGGGN